MNSAMEKFGENGAKISSRAPLFTVSELQEKFELQRNDSLIGKLAHCLSDLIRNLKSF